MSENNIPGPSRRRYSALFTQQTKSETCYDPSKEYPADYRNSLESEIQQWNDQMKTAHEEYLQWRTADKKAHKALELDVDKSSFGDFFDHTIYDNYINTVENFCTKVNCAVELQKEKKKKAEYLNKDLTDKCKYINVVLEKVVKSEF